MKIASVCPSVTIHCQAVSYRHTHGQVQEGDVVEHGKTGCFGVRGLYTIPPTCTTMTLQASKSNSVHNKDEKYRLKTSLIIFIDEEETKSLGWLH